MPPIPELEAIRKAQIIEAGLHTIAQRGCANVTMDDICSAAGLSKGGLAHYYRSKNELFKAVFEAFFDRIFQRSRETMARFDDPLDQVLSFDWLYDADDPDMEIGYPLLFDFMAVSVHDGEYQEIFYSWIDNWVSLLSGALEERHPARTIQKFRPGGHGPHRFRHLPGRRHPMVPGSKVPLPSVGRRLVSKRHTGAAGPVYER